MKPQLIFLASVLLLAMVFACQAKHDGKPRTIILFSQQGDTLYSCDQATRIHRVDNGVFFRCAGGECQFVSGTIIVK